MKNTYLLFALITWGFLSACNNAASDRNAFNDTLNNVTTPTTITYPTEQGGHLYYDLQTHHPIEIEKDEKTGRYVDVSTHNPVNFFYDPISKDTFDSKGRLVNNALIYSDGNYELEEAKVKSDEDQVKMKNEK